MCRLILCILILTGAALVGGCYTSKDRDSLDKCLQERILLVDRMTQVLEDVTEDSSADEVKEQLEALLKEQAALDKRERRLKKVALTGATMKRLATVEREDLLESLTRLETAREKAMENTEVARILKTLSLPRLPAKSESLGD